MSLVEIAQIYTDLVKLDREIPEQEQQAKDQVNALRTKYHEILMDKMREEGLCFSDRFKKMRTADDIHL